MLSVTDVINVGDVPRPYIVQFSDGSTLLSQDLNDIVLHLPTATYHLGLSENFFIYFNVLITQLVRQH